MDVPLAASLTVDFFQTLLAGSPIILLPLQLIVLLDALDRDVQGRRHSYPIIVHLPQLHCALLRPGEKALHVAADGCAGTGVVPWTNRLSLEVMSRLNSPDGLALLPLSVVKESAESSLPMVLHSRDGGHAQSILHHIGHHLNELHPSAASKNRAHPLVEIHYGLVPKKSPSLYCTKSMDCSITKTLSCQDRAPLGHRTLRAESNALRATHAPLLTINILSAGSPSWKTSSPGSRSRLKTRRESFCTRCRETPSTKEHL
mmetsp:Transcript_40096/g.90061  ORF Transcript_40096/g.90061 Transcript_40096/m.90061 type:complete len:259 (+) Transcript_40096:539-1315(+)